MKKIKKQLAVAVTVALLAFSLSPAIALADTATPITTQEAETAETTTTPDTSKPTHTTIASATEYKVVDADGKTVTPDGWLMELIGKLQEALAFEPARKVELNERRALAKLAEAQKLMQDGKSEAAEKSLNQYTDKITKAEEFLKEVNTESEKYETLAKALASVNSNNVQVLGNLLEKLPDQAAQKIALNVVRSMEKAITKMEKREAKVAQPTTPTTPETTPVIERELSEKQVKTALKDFKKALKQNGKINIEDSEQQDAEDETVEPTSVTVTPAKVNVKPNAKPQMEHINALTSEQSKEDQSKKEVRGKDNNGTKKEVRGKDNNGTKKEVHEKDNNGGKKDN